MNKLFPIINRVIYPSKYKYINQYRKIDEYTLDEMNWIRVSKLKKLVDHFVNFPFYKNVLSSITNEIKCVEDIKNLPIVDKQYIRNNLESIKIIDHQAVLRSTSGSTGENFKFYIPKMRRAAAAGAFDDYLARIGIKKFYGKTIGIWGGNLHKPGEYRPLLDRLKYFLLNTELWPGYGLNEETAIEYINKMNVVKPTLLYGYPSYLDTLAKYGEKNNVMCYKPEVIVVSGEQLTQNVRTRIETYFNTKIFNRYGSVEFGVIAHELNDHDGLYINPLRFITETSEDGEFLITDLDNLVTPFIRYKIGDLGELTSKGNWQIIRHLLGRSNDVIETRSGRIIPSQFFTILSRTADGVEKYQFVQTSETLIEMRVVPNDKFNDESIAIIKNNFAKNFGDEVEIDIVITNNLETTEYGKHKFVLRKDNVHE